MACDAEILAVADDEIASINAWVNYHAVMALVATGVVLFSGGMEPLLLVIAVSFAIYLFRHRRILRSLQPFGGYANLLTLIRLVSIFVAALLIGKVDSYWFLVLFSSNVVLDGVDGYVARKVGQTTQFGAAFDREVDAMFVLVACLYFKLAVGIGAWILVPGLLPYVYRLVAWTIRDSTYSERRQPYAAFLAGINFVLLLIAVAVPRNVQFGVLVMSTGIVTMSFIMSFWGLFRYRNANSVL